MEMMFQDINNTEDLNRYYTALVQWITQTSEQCVPTTKFNPNLCPFWSPELKALHVEQKRLRYLWVNDGKPRGSSIDSYREYKKAKHLFAKQYKHDAIKYEHEQLAKVATDVEMDSKMFWR
jgi:hypothetical protein